MNKKRYTYTGSVCLYGKVIADYWKAETWAVSARAAESNFKYQFRRMYGYVNNVPLQLETEKVRETV